MGADLFQLTAVNAALALLVVLPFVPAAFVLFRGGPWSKILLTAFVMGSCLQAILGLVWSHLIGNWPSGEIIIFGAVWLYSLWWYSHRKREEKEVLFETSSKKNELALVLILFCAFVVRSIHPLEVAYLGQSDAYTHLHYLHNISDSGRLINPSYPAGYHWILALPVLAFSIDPYLVVRFGGAFFGVALVLAVYVMLDQLFTRRAALFGSFCAACFPPMTLLMKTGVGAFANQFGLFLLPVIFLLYTLNISSERKIAEIRGLLLLALCGLATAVPMMLLHVLLIFCLERFILFIRAPRLWFTKTLRIILIVLPALCLLLFHLCQVGPGQRFQTANILVEYGGIKQPLAEKVTAKVKTKVAKYDPTKREIAKLVADSPYFRLLIDYFSVKRYGFGNSALNMVGWLLAGIFICFLVYGFITVKTHYLMIGLWGGLTSVQAATGFMQFSSYQREGWSLLVATSCLSGILAAWIVQPVFKNRLFRHGLLLLMFFAFLGTVFRPPQHPAIQSSVEDFLVRSIRFFGQNPSDLSTICRNQKKLLCVTADLFVEELPLTLVTRRFVGWGSQGEIAPNVLLRGSVLRVVTVGKQNMNDIFRSGNQYLVLIDDKNSLSSGDVVSAFAMMSPSMVKATMRQQEHLFEANEKILEYLENLPEPQWRIDKMLLSASLTAFVVTPHQSAQSSR